MEGKETRFGEWASALFAVATTGTSTGAVNASHDSLTPAGGGTVLVNMMLGEIAPGGVGAGIYGILIMAILAVFVAGLMVGRTPELLGKKISARQMTYVALYTLTTPAARAGRHRASRSRAARHADAMGNPGGHGFSEVLYAYTSAANNNGSAFGGITVTSDFFQITLGLAMLLGRLLPIVLVLLLAGSLAEQGKVPVTAGTLPTHTAPLRRDAGRRHRDHDRPHLLPGARPRTDCGGTRMSTTTTLHDAGASTRSDHHVARRGIAARLSAKASSSPRRRAQAGPATHVALAGDVPGLARLGRDHDRGRSPTPASSPSPSRSGCGSPSSSATSPRRWPRAAARPRPPRCAPPAPTPWPDCSTPTATSPRCPRTQLKVGDRVVVEAGRGHPRRR